MIMRKHPISLGATVHPARGQAKGRRHFYRFRVRKRADARFDRAHGHLVSDSAPRSWEAVNHSQAALTHGGVGLEPPGCWSPKRQTRDYSPARTECAAGF